MIKAGVIGDPISHSLSPIIHNFFLEKYNILGSYQAIKITKENLLKDVKTLIDQDFAGFNVTIPHKEEIFKICDYKSKSAEITKAVNTVIITKDKKIFGHNSDCDGFLKNLLNCQKTIDLKNKNIFVIGAGGASRAAIYAFLKSRVNKIFITNRSKERVDNLILDFLPFVKKNGYQENSIEFLDFNLFQNSLSNCDLLVNTSSLGMTGQENLKIDLKHLNKNAIVYDIVYKPLMTQILIDAKSRGNEIVTGIGMLVEQALVGFEAWFKEKPIISKELEEILLKK